MVFPSRPFYSYLVQRSSDLMTWEDMNDGRFYGSGQDLRYLVTDAVKLPPLRRRAPLPASRGPRRRGQLFR